MTPKAYLGLQHVHTLYVMQVELLGILQKDLTEPLTRKQAKEQVKKFEELLKKADHRYMGGEDVLQALHELPAEVMTKLKKSPVAVAKTKKGATKVKGKKKK
jgi:hypothetical protein